MFISFIPFIVIIILIFLKTKDYVSICTGTAVALIIHLFMAKNGNLHTISVSQWFSKVILANIPIIISILLLGYFMYLINESSIINEIMNNSNLKISCTNLITVVSALFSVDDYLSVSVTSMLSSKIYGNNNVQKRKIGLAAGMLSVFFCLINPVSSWSPVILGEYNNSGIPHNYYYIGLKYNLIIVFLLISSTMLTFGIKQYSDYTNMSGKQKCFFSKGIIDVCIIFSVLITLFLITQKVLGLPHPLILSSFISNILTTIWLLKRNFLLSYNKVSKVIIKTIKGMTPLIILLLSIWSFVYVMDEGLNIGNNIIELISKFGEDYYFLPSLIFIIASAFSYVTSSSYGSFGLFIALASKVSLGMSDEIRIITISAAVAGSLFALFSIGSDITGISAVCTGCLQEDIRKIGRVYAKKMFICGFIGYIGLGFLSPKLHLLYSIVIILLYIISTTGFNYFNSLIGIFCLYKNFHKNNTKKLHKSINNNPLKYLLEYRKQYMIITLTREKFIIYRKIISG